MLMEKRVVKTFCARMDHGGCGLLVHLENGKVTRIDGDPDSPLSRGYLCAKGRGHTERLNHPDRLKYPLLRTGDRGGGAWKRIPWVEALARLAEAIEKTSTCHGPQTICFGHGTPKGLELYLMIRLANVLGIPNVTTPGSVCHMPRETASFISCGFFPVPDYDYPPTCVLAWGSNLFDTNEEGILGIRLRKTIEKGARLAVIDPRRTDLAAMADLWIQLKPGTDLALAIGVAKVMVEENLLDQDFVERWTTGFDQFREHLGRYRLEEISQITWTSEEKIVQLAHLYGRMRPACIQWGNAVEHTHQSFQTARALVALMAISGNLGTSGGNVEHADPPLLRPGRLVLSKAFPDKKERIMSADFRLAAMMGFVPSQLIVESALADEDDRIRMMYLQGANPLLSFPDAKRTYEALKRLDFLAVAEIFLTPTAQLADLVLPAAMHFEFDDIGHYGLRHGFVLARPKIVDPPEECWPDSKILNELGKRLGYEEYFWSDIRECLNEILKPSGMTYDDFVEFGMLKGRWETRGFESNGFKTPSGKIELYSQRLEDWGYDPLPAYREQISGTGRLAFSKAFPLTLTSAKDPFSFHSANRNIPFLRRLSPDPIMMVNPDTAQNLGLNEGGWALLSTQQGTIRQKVKLSADLDPRVVVASVGWWFPERKDLELSGWKESNINILTSNTSPYDPAIGTSILRGIPCRVQPDRESDPRGEKGDHSEKKAFAE